MYDEIANITKGRPSLMGFFIGGLAQDSFSREAGSGPFVNRIKSWAFFLMKGGRHFEGGCGGQEERMELPTVYYMGLGLASMFTYHYWDKHLRKQKCRRCGQKVKRTGHYYCYPCFTERAREEAIRYVDQGL